MGYYYYYYYYLQYDRIQLYFDILLVNNIMQLFYLLENVVK